MRTLCSLTSVRQDSVGRLPPGKAEQVSSTRRRLDRVCGAPPQPMTRPRYPPLRTPSGVGSPLLCTVDGPSRHCPSPSRAHSPDTESLYLATPRSACHSEGYHGRLELGLKP
jgi:hypothetical protein